VKSVNSFTFKVMVDVLKREEMKAKSLLKFGSSGWKSSQIMLLKVFDLSVIRAVI